MHLQKGAQRVSCTAFVAWHDTRLTRILALSAFSVPVCHVQRVCVLQVFTAAVAFATSLFLGGNAVAQGALVKYLETDRSHAFISTFSKKLQSSLAAFRAWKSEVNFVTATVPGLTGQVHQVCGGEGRGGRGAGAVRRGCSENCFFFFGKDSL